jgi:hypothetical protein
MEKFNIRCLMAAILEGNGIDRGMAVREAFFITDDVKNLSQLRIEDRLKAQEKHARGY